MYKLQDGSNDSDSNSDNDSDSDLIKTAIENALADGIYTDEKIIILSNIESTSIIPTSFRIDSFE